MTLEGADIGLTAALGGPGAAAGALLGAALAAGCIGNGGSGPCGTGFGGTKT